MGTMSQLKFDFKDQVVVVTGAAGQLGSEICHAFFQAGAKVVGVDVKNDVHKKDDSISFNISDAIECKKGFESIIAKHGKIDVLINNAGVSTFEPFEDRPEDKFNWVMEVNLKGTFFCIQNFVNFFDAGKLKSGTIVNIASIYGVIIPDFRIYTDCARKNSEIYGATKAGIIQMTRYFAVHLAERGIRVNAISPGGIFNPESPQGSDFVKNYSFRCPMKRMASAHEMIGGIMYFASDAAGYTTGQNLVIDGGMSCW